MSDVAAVAAPVAAVEAPAAVETPVVDAAAAPAPEAPAKGAVRGPDGKFTKPGAPAEKAAAPAPESRKFKVKVDGQELEVTEEDLVRDYQLKATSHKRFEEVAKTKQEIAAKEEKVVQFLQALNDPKQFAAAAKQMGLSHQQLAQLGDALLEPIIQAQLEQEKLAQATPEQKRLMELERENAKYKAEFEQRQQQEAEAKKKADAEAATQRQAQHRQAFESQIIQAMEEINLPKTPHLAKEVVEVIYEGMSRGIELTPKEVAQEVFARKQAEHQSMLEAMDEAGLSKFIPKSAADKLRKAQVEQYKAGNPLLTSKPVVSERAAPAAPAPKGKGQSMTSIMNQFAMGKFGK